MRISQYKRCAMAQKSLKHTAVGVKTGKGVERTERSGGLEERWRRENMRDRTLCHFVSMCPLKGMSQWTDKQQNSRVTPLSIKRLFLLLARTLFHSFCKLYTNASGCTMQLACHCFQLKRWHPMSAQPELGHKAHAVPQNTLILGWQKPPMLM